MKKLISTLLALCMVLAMGIVAFAAENVAQIGDTPYSTLDGAVTAANPGDEIKILVAGTYKVPTGKNLTITGAADGVVFECGQNNIGMGSASVTFNNVTFNWAANGWPYHGLAHCGEMEYNDCVFNGTVFLYGTSETFNNCEFNVTGDTYNVWTYGAKEVEFNGCTFNSAGKSVLIYSEDRDLVNNVTVSDCDFFASSSVEGKAAIEMDSSLTSGINLTIDSETTAEGFDSGSVSGNSLWNNKKGSEGDNKDINVVVGDETVLTCYEAQIGDTKYLTLAEAISAVGAGDVVIELLNDATLDYNAREAYGTDDTTSVTINGNNKTLTLNQKDSDWSSLGLKNPDAKFIFKNMTIEKTGYGDTSGAWNTHTINVTSKLDMEEVTVNNSINVEKDANLKNVTINEANDYYGLWITAEGQTVNAEGLEINGRRGIKIADQYVNDPAKVTLNVKDSVFSTAKKAAVLVSSKEGADITADNVNIEKVAEDKVNFVWVDEDWIEYYGRTTVEGASVVGEADVAGDIIRAYLNEKGRITVDMQKVTYYKNVTLNLYSGEELLTVSRLDTEEYGPGYYAELTGNIGVTDQGSDTWPVDKWTPYEGVVPTEVVLVIDGVVADYVDIIYNGNPDYNNSDKLDEKEWNAVGGINPAPLVKPENAIVIDLTGKDKTEDEANPNTGAPVMMPVAAVFAVLSGAAVLKRK
ncbi:MAG: hypothetical protein IJM98_10405 [Oscillospiraceae bacterium]|nr:hypothetical protein [Oscillospiraceae bacterium]